MDDALPRNQLTVQNEPTSEMTSNSGTSDQARLNVRNSETNMEENQVSAPETVAKVGNEIDSISAEAVSIGETTQNILEALPIATGMAENTSETALAIIETAQNTSETAPITTETAQTISETASVIIETAQNSSETALTPQTVQTVATEDQVASNDESGLCDGLSDNMKLLFGFLVIVLIISLIIAFPVFISMSGEAPFFSDD